MFDMPFAKATKVLNEHWDGFLPVDPMHLAQQMGALVVGDPSLAQDGISGSFEYDASGRPLIKFNPFEPLVRQRFTVAHEIGHWLLGHVELGQCAHRDPAASYTMDKSKPREVEANRFAAQLLMPSKVVRAMRRMIRDASPAAVMAREFEVSEAAMRFRLNNLGL